MLIAFNHTKETAYALYGLKLNDHRYTTITDLHEQGVDYDRARRIAVELFQFNRCVIHDARSSRIQEFRQYRFTGSYLDHDSFIGKTVGEIWN